MTEEHKLELISNRESLDNVRAFLKDKVDHAKYGEEAASTFELAVVEWCENIIKYAYGNKPGEYSINVILEDTSITAEIKDKGIPFDIQGYEPPDHIRRFSRGVGGKLGIRTIKTMMSEVKHIREDGINTNIFKKDIT